jgi:hypothetical protein
MYPEARVIDVGGIIAPASAKHLNERPGHRRLSVETQARPSVRTADACHEPCRVTRMNYAPLRIQRLLRELSEELLQEYGAEQSARMLDTAAAELRRDADARATRPVADWARVSRGMSRRV